ncbi:hypothetical protein AM1_H0034 (plasmid) [Acaryochloris marina MBIC11017]|uniref:Transposase n=1 Tax=Acaryochloris marina (strain MBIC 11017) TaxID=329726 RepID=A8ZQU8_ACAM1|nr:hypothetical protein AM1_H0034 [Acaryochloris marina MBIC11017]
MVNCQIEPVIVWLTSRLSKVYAEGMRTKVEKDMGFRHMLAGYGNLKSLHRFAVFINEG